MVDAVDGAAVGFGDPPKENIPLPTIVGLLLSSLLAAAAVAADAPKPNEELAGAVRVELAVVAPAAANDPKVTAGFFGSVAPAAELVVLLVVLGEPNANPVLLLTVSAGLLLAAGEPKLNPLLVVVVEVTVSELFAASDDAGLEEPKLNPPEPKATAAGVGSFFSPVFGLSVESDEAAGLIPKLNPDVVAGAGVVVAVLPLLPKVNLGLSSELVVVLVVDVTEPKLKPVLGDVVELAEELAGTPKENPVVLGASVFPSESLGTPKLNLAAGAAAAEDDLLPKEKDGAFSGVDPGLACSQQAHLDREASFRVMQALHSHLLVDCCATSALKP